MKSSKYKFKVLYLRRLTQIGILISLILIAYLSSNPYHWSPSRIALRTLPPPKVIPVSGDTWAFKIGNFSFVHPVAFIEELLAFKKLYLPLLKAMIIPFLITLILGRVFCSFMCPAGFIFELTHNIRKRFKKTNLEKTSSFKDYRFLLLGISFIFSIILSIPIISIFDPPHIIGREFMYFFAHHQISLSGTGFILILIIIEIFIFSRLWCNYFCPSGGCLSLIGKKRLLKIKMEKTKCIHCGKCDEVCPYYLFPMKLAENKPFDWTKCDNCGLCRDVCPAGAISYKFFKN